MRTVRPVRTTEHAARKAAPGSVRTAHATKDPHGAGDAEKALMAEVTAAEPTAAEHESESYETFRVGCPDCGRPIALLAEEERLPEHARCVSTWNPFGLTVCQGSGRPAADAVPLGGDEPQEQDMGVLLTLPKGLDWRTQPFSHAGRPGGRRVVRTRARAA
jgi:hypothetical protein